MVAGDQRAALFLGDGSAGAAEVDGDAVLHHDRGEVAVAGESAGGGDGEWPQVRHACNILVAEHVRTGLPTGILVVTLIELAMIRPGAGKVGGVHVQRQVRLLSTFDGCVAAVEVAAQDLGERVGPLLRRGARAGGVVDRIPRLGQCRQRRQKHLAGDGIEIALHRDASVQGFRGVELVAFGVFAGWEFVGFEDPLEPGDAGAHGHGGRGRASGGVQQHFPARIQRFVRHAAGWGFAEFADQRGMLGRDGAVVEGVGNFGLPAQHFAQREDPCRGRYFQQCVRSQPLLDAPKPEDVERHSARVDFSDGNHP